MGTGTDRTDPHAPEPAAPSGHRMPDPLDLEDLERLADPSRSLFERQPELEGVHRASVLSALVDAAGSLGAVAGVALVAAVQMLGGFEPGNLLDIGLLAGFLLTVGAVSAIVGWRTRTWELTDGSIVLHGGVVNRRDLQVPYEHIHTVNMSSTLLERVFGLMTLDLDTGAAGSEGELTRIKGLKAGMAHALREELFRRKARALESLRADAPGTAADGRTTCAVGEGADAAARPNGIGPARCPDSPMGADATPSAHPSPASAARDAASSSTGCDPSDPQPIARHTLSTGQLILASATEARVAAQTFAFVILLAQGANFLQESRLVNLNDAAHDIAALPAAVLVAIAASLLLVSLMAGVVISFVTSLVRYAGYRADRYEDRVVVERGLLGRTSHTVAIERIQSIEIRRGLLRQAIGYAEVRAIVVSGAGSAGESSTSDGIVLHPFLRIRDVEAFLGDIAPAYAGMLEGIRTNGLPPVAARRLVTRTLLKLVLLLAVFSAAHILADLLIPEPLADGFLLAGVDALLIALAVVLTVRMTVNAVLRFRDSRIGHDARRLAVVKGGILRVSTFVRRPHLQHAAVSSTPFQRRVGVATFRARTAASGDIALADITEADADELLDWYR